MEGSKVNAATHAPTSRRSWVLVLLSTGVLGAILWAGYSTDYSLAGTMPDLLFAPAVGIVGLISSSWLRSRARRRSEKALSALACSPSIIGGCLPTAIMLIVLVTPFVIGLLFAASEVFGETQMQQAVSPDQARVSVVYFRAVGAYAGGHGRIYVRVRPRWLPIVERDVYYISASYASQATGDYVRWVDEDTLFITETGEEIDVDGIGLRVPKIIAVPYCLILGLISVGRTAR